MRGNVVVLDTPRTAEASRMSRPLLAEPPPKRQRAPGEDEVDAEEPGDLEEDREFRRLEAVSTVQDELNALEDEEARQVRVKYVYHFGRKYKERWTVNKKNKRSLYFRL